MIRQLVITSIAAWMLSAPAAAQEFTLRIHSFSSPRALDHTAHLNPWAKKVEKESKGRIKVEVFPAMQLGGKASDLVSQLEDGVVDIIWTVPGFTPGRFPGVEGLELPFMNTGLSETMTPAAMEFITTYLMDEFKGMKIISVFATDAALIHTRNKPVATLEDFKGLKLRVSGRFTGEAVKGLGATPVSILLRQVYEALARNQVDGILTNWAITAPFRLYEVTKYHTDFPLYQIMLMTLMSKKSYDRLPKDLQAVIDANSGVEYATRMGKIFDGATDGARQLALKAGNKLIIPTPAEILRWKEAVKPAYKVWIAEMNKRGRDGQKLFDAMWRITGKYGRK